MPERFIRLILGNYALYSYENGDCTERFFEILDEACEGTDKQKIYEKIWKTGLIFDGVQGIKFFHKAIHEFFVAMKLSTLDVNKISEWLDKNVLNEKYDEVICYLTGIVSNQQKQNYILDYLEMHNLKLYVKALESRKNFDVVEQELNLDYAQVYYAQILKTYDIIVQTFFYNIRHVFDGYNINGTEKVCLRGDISFASESITIEIYNGASEAKTLDITLSEENQIYMISSEGKKTEINSSVFTKGKRH